VPAAGAARRIGGYVKFSSKIMKLLHPCRHFEKHQKEFMMPLVKYAASLEAQVRELEQRIRSYEQPDMFVDKYNGRTTTLADSEVEAPYNITEHVRSIIKTFGIDSDQASGFMIRKGMSREEFVKLSESS